MTGITASLFLLLATGAGVPAQPGKVQGKLHAKTFVVRSAIAGNVYGGAGGGVGMIILSDAPDECAQRGQNARTKKARRLYLQVAEVEGMQSSEPESTGTYRLQAQGEDAQMTAAAWYTEDDDKCHESSKISAISGQVVLDKLIGDDGMYAGSFSLVLKNGEKIRGSFQAPECKVFSEGVDSKKTERTDPTCR